MVDDTGFPKQGKRSVGVARQYCGQVGQQDNCQVAVSLSVSTWNASLPIAWRLYLPEVWCQDAKRCRQAGVSEGVEFQTKPEIALRQIRQALEQQVPSIQPLQAGNRSRQINSSAQTRRLFGTQFVTAVQPAPQEMLDSCCGHVSAHVQNIWHV